MHLIDRITMKNTQSKLLKSLFVLLSIVALNSQAQDNSNISPAINYLLLDSHAPSYFVDSQEGNDNNDGKTISTAWKTLAKINNMSFQPGDIIGFKKGGIFLGSLTIKDSGISGHPIVFTSYGTGAKPIISGIKPISGEWVEYETNKWKMPIAKVTRLYLNNSEQKTIGTVESTKEPHWEEFGDTLYNGVYIWSNGYLYYYSKVNPSTLGIMTGSMGNIGIKISSRYVDIVGLNIIGYYNYSIFAYSESDYCNIKYNTIGFRSGHGIKTEKVTGWIIERNLINSSLQIDYTGFDNTYRGASNRGSYDGFINYGGFTNGEIRYNDFTNWGHAALSFVSSNLAIKNNKIHHNIFTSPNIVYGRAFAWSGEQVTNNEAYNNYVYDMRTRGQINGVNNTVHHNWFYDFKRSTIKTDEIGQAMGMEAYKGRVYGNKFIHNTIKNIESPGFEFIAQVSNTARVYGNTISENIFDHCGTDPYRDKSKGIGLNIQFYTDIGPQIFTNNAFINSSSNNTNSSTDKTIRFLNINRTPNEFNALNGTNGNMISGNTNNVTDQGAGILERSKIGVNGIE